MRKLTSEEIKKTELSILLAFRDACEKHGLHPYLAYGTLLGAVRHKGFIPWDDDIDVALPRPEYNRVAELAKTDRFLPENLRVCCMENGDYPFPFMKVYDTTTKVEAKLLGGDTAEHLWIDVFPVDGAAPDPAENSRIYRKANRVKLTLLNCRAKWGTGSTIPAMLIKLILIPLSRLYGEERCRQWLIREAGRYPYETAENVGILMWSLYGDRGIIPKAAFERTTEVVFEGHSFRAVEDWDAYLRSYYGDDYMTPPPENRRTVHEIEAWQA